MERSGRGRNSGRLSLSVAKSWVPSLKDEAFEVVRAGVKGMDFQSSVHQTMEFLSRTWSPSSARFFNELSSLLIQDHQLDEDNINDEANLFKQHGVEAKGIQFTGSNVTKKNRIWMGAERMKAFINEKTFRRFFGGTQMKRKEKVRFQMAQVHAALSVARLASSIAGTIANCSIEPADTSRKGITTQVGGWDKNMNLAVASAATLVAAVCAEVAESVGARRVQINSIINRSLVPASATDILDMTAAAATSLRGAKALEVRKASARHDVEDQMILMGGTPLRVCKCGENLKQLWLAGKFRLRVVSVYIKRGLLMLRLGKKILRGAICTYEEYRITGTSEDNEGEVFAEHSHALCSISLAITEGVVKLLFEDKKQYMQWSYTISYLFSTGF
ncbi:hypothetical protein HPP92_014462 [Vanilla planifolia]|uniref:VAN3-binding protein-like auxin canalisation domain-containing protein n=1 Tax=Vanilla planifolia TaxID=51239 RepID=A0A835UWW9_VANPL|nr:hypothetical protein HPP92_014462 [Vanilla planifolia]